MLLSMELLTVAITLVVLYQAFVSIRIAWYRGYTWKQKALQLVLIWLVPFLGAAVLHAFLSADLSSAKKLDTRFFTDGGNNPPGIGG
jgi:hypothetical protein